MWNWKENTSLKSPILIAAPKAPLNWENVYNSRKYNEIEQDLQMANIENRGEGV